MAVASPIEHVAGRIADGRDRLAEAAADVVGRCLDRYSGPAFDRLRRHRPIVSAKGLAIVTRAADVREVLSEHEHFTAELYNAKMVALTGPFVLGLDDTPLYRRDDDALRAAVRGDDLARIRESILTEARRRIAAAPGGEIDVVADLADPAIERVCSQTLGAPGPDATTQVRWARSLFQEIFINVGNVTTVRERAVADAGHMRSHIDGVIKRRKAALAAGEDAPDDVLSRLLAAQLRGEGLHDIAIRHNLIGLIAGWIPTASKAFAHAIEELLRRPSELERAQRAARDGNADLVAAHVFEALRFRPQNWSLLRVCADGRTVASGTERATTIRAGAVVVAATQSAMFDETEVDAPREFRLDRPWADYMHFGHGLHSCFGEQINRVQLPALATALLDGPPIRRAPGDAGRLSVRGPYPASLTVALRDGEQRGAASAHGA